MRRVDSGSRDDSPEAAQLKRAAIVDQVLKIGAYSSIAVAFVAPNIVVALDKPLSALDATLDKRARRREVMRTMYYMKANGYLAGDYEHGLELTPKAKRRLMRLELKEAAIKPTPFWDHIWRIVIYDIPQTHTPARQSIAAYLRTIGCFQLQKSTWITPFDCREAVEMIATQTKCERYLTYFEARYIANESVLIRRFARRYPMTDFTHRKE